MNYIQKIVDIDIPFIYPKKLQKMALNYNSDRSISFKSSFEYPPKDINQIITVVLEFKFEKLNFFDITKLLNHLENDNLPTIEDKNLFAQALFKLFQESKRYISLIILKIVVKIFISTELNSYKQILQKTMDSVEFKFAIICINKQFTLLYKVLKVKSLNKVLKYYGLQKIFINLSDEYASFLLEQVSKQDLSSTTLFQHYKNNLFQSKNIVKLHNQIDKSLTFMEKKLNIKNANYLETILISYFGDINNEKSNWYIFDIPIDLIERYKRLKGIFEFQRFVDIANYLTTNPNIHFNSDANSSDEIRLKNRTLFWSNYDERFSSVTMWVNDEDYSYLSIDKPVSLNGIRKLKNINNEACIIEFKDYNLLIIEFFRLKDDNRYFQSMIFDNYQSIDLVKRSLYKEDTVFNIEMYDYLLSISNAIIKHKFLWQGWVDEFLRNKNIYPNNSVLNGRNFNSPKKLKYTKEYGLSETRKEAISKDITYDDIIVSY